MHHAAECCHKEFAEWLFSAGASVSDKDEVGISLRASDLVDVFASTLTCMHAVLVEEVLVDVLLFIHYCLDN